jgi:transposase
MMSETITVGIDPHRAVFTAAAIDERGRFVGHEHFENTRAGHSAALAWMREQGTVDRIGVEGASGLGRPLATYLVAEGIDVRDVPSHRTALRQRGRHEGKSDRLDAHRVAVETQTNDALACAFKNSRPAPPDHVRDQISLWHNTRTSLRKIRVQLIGELDDLIHQLPEGLRTAMPERATVRARINAIAKLDVDDVTDPIALLRLTLIEHRITMLKDVIAQDNAAERELARLVTQTGSSLPEVPGIATLAAAEILLETGDVRRFTEAGFARFNGTAPIPASSGEAGGRPRRHRLNRGGNRRLNAVIHRIAMIQLRCDPRARELYDRAMSNGHTKREAMRILKRHLSNILYRTMARDLSPLPA